MAVESVRLSSSVSSLSPRKKPFALTGSKRSDSQTRTYRRAAQHHVSASSQGKENGLSVKPLEAVNRLGHRAHPSRLTMIRAQSTNASQVSKQNSKPRNDLRKWQARPQCGDGEDYFCGISKYPTTPHYRATKFSDPNCPLTLLRPAYRP